MKMKEVYVTDKAPRPVGPYSQVIKAGGFLFLAGQIPLTSENVMNEGDVVQQAHQVMRNLQAVLEKAGSTLNHAAKLLAINLSLNFWQMFGKFRVLCLYSQRIQLQSPGIRK